MSLKLKSYAFSNKSIGYATAKLYITAIPFNNRKTFFLLNGVSK